MKPFIFVFVLSVLSKGLFSQQPDSLVLNKWDNGFPKEVRIGLTDKACRIQKYYSSGRLQSVINYNGTAKLDGAEKSWYESGVQKMEGYWKNGVNSGMMTLWYPSGQKSFEGKYLENGVPDGAWKGWYENGQIQYEQYYSNGLKTGKWISYKKDGGAGTVQYYENGLLVKEETF